MFRAFVFALIYLCSAQNWEDPFKEFHHLENVKTEVLENPMNDFFEHDTDLLYEEKHLSGKQLPYKNIQCINDDSNAKYYKIHLVRFINLFLRNFGANVSKDKLPSDTVSMLIKASQDDLDVLRKFGSGVNVSLADVDKSFSSLFDTVELNERFHPDPGTPESWSYEMSRTELQTVLLLPCIIVSIFWLILKDVNWKKVLSIILFVMYIALVSHSLWKQYQTKYIERIAEMRRLSSDACADIGPVRRFIKYNVLSFIMGEDPCYTEIKVREGSLWVELDFSKALAEPISLVFNVFIQAADAVGISIQKYTSHMPFMLRWTMQIALSLLLPLLILYMMMSRFSLMGLLSSIRRPLAPGDHTSPSQIPGSSGSQRNSKSNICVNIALPENQNDTVFSIEGIKFERRSNAIIVEKANSPENLLTKRQKSENNIDIRKRQRTFSLDRFQIASTS